MYADGSTGLAVMRRDGFSSLDAGDEAGAIVTRLLTFQGHCLFVNIRCPAGELRVEILDEAGRVIEPYGTGTCIPVTADNTRHRVVWEQTDSLGLVSGRRVKFRFQLRNGSLFSFWVTSAHSGVSGGYVAAGGPGFPSARDL